MSGAGVIISRAGGVQSGNPKIIDENWDGMAKYIAAIEKAIPI